MRNCAEHGRFANADVYKVKDRHNTLWTYAFAVYSSALEFGPAQLRLWSKKYGLCPCHSVGIKGQ